MYEEKYYKIESLMDNQKYEEAENEIKELLKLAENNSIEGENETRYYIDTYIELLLYYNYFKPLKINIPPQINIARLYYYEGIISYNLDDYNKAKEKFYEARRWNPIKAKIRLLEARTYRKSDLNMYKQKIEEAYKYIYTKEDLYAYIYELGVYNIYSNNLELAKALFLFNIMSEYPNGNSKIWLEKIEEVRPDLKGGMKRYAVIEELKKNNINIDIDENIINILKNDYKRLMEDQDKGAIYDISNCLYNLIYDTNYVFFDKMKTNMGLEISVPSVCSVLKNEARKKLNLSESKYAFKVDNKIMILNQVGIIDKDTFEKRYQELLKSFENDNIKILEQNTIQNEENKIYQLLYKGKEFRDRVVYIFAYINGIEVHINWEEHFSDMILGLNYINNTLSMAMVKSLKYIGKSEKVNNQNEEKDMQTNENVKYNLQPENYPVIQILIPKELGKPEKVSARTYKIKNDNFNVEIKFGKQPTADEFVTSIKNWIDEYMQKYNYTIIEYKKEKVNDNPVEVYILQNNKKIKKIIKGIYLKKCFVIFIGNPVDKTRNLIDLLLKSANIDDEQKESKITPEKNSLKIVLDDEENNKLEIEKNIKLANIYFKQGYVSQCIKVLEKDIKKLVYKDDKYKDDIFWPEMSIFLYLAIVLNNFYKNNKVSINEIKRIISDKNIVIGELEGYIQNFKNTKSYNKNLEGISDKKMLNDFIKILSDALNSLDTEAQGDNNKTVNDRDTLLQKMNSKDDIRKMSIDTQKIIIKDKIIQIRMFLESCNINTESYQLSKRQERTKELALSDDNNLVNSYWEIYDFIDDYGDRKKGKIYSVEKDEIYKMLEKLEEKARSC